MSLLGTLVPSLDIERLAKLSSVGEYRIVQSGHAMMIDAPSVVIGAILETAAAVRSQRAMRGRRTGGMQSGTVK